MPATDSPSLDAPAPGSPAAPTPTGTAAETVRLWIDTHAHLHDVYEPAGFLDAAWSHFAAAGAGIGVLCLTKMQGSEGFNQLAESERIGDWSVRRVCRFGLKVSRDDGATIGVIAGRQVKCDNGLEVAAVGQLVELDDGQPFEDSVEAVHATGALTVLAYGVGKWSGARGAQVRRLLEEGPSDLAFGDNSGRLGFGDQALLRRARELGRTVLAGSDPLRLKMASRRAGCWGVVVDVPGGDDFDEGWTERVVDALRTAGPNPKTYGGRVSLPTAIAQQIGVRLP